MITKAGVLAPRGGGGVIEYIVKIFFLFALLLNLKVK